MAFLKRLFEFLLLATWLLLAVSVHTKIDSSKKALEKIHLVSFLKIKKSNLFEINVEGKTFVVTTELNNSPNKEEISNLLKKVDSLGVVFLRKQENNIWLVDILLHLNGKKTNFKDCF